MEGVEPRRLGPIEARAHLARENQSLLLVNTDQQSSEPFGVLRLIGEAPDDELLFVDAFFFQPCLCPTGAVNRVRSLGNNPFEAHAAGLGEDVLAGTFEMLAEMQMGMLSRNDGAQCLLPLQQGPAPQIDAIEVECIPYYTSS